jgi:hypothetical protein
VHLVEKLCSFYLLDIQKHSWRTSENKREMDMRHGSLIPLPSEISEYVLVSSELTGGGIKTRELSKCIEWGMEIPMRC